MRCILDDIQNELREPVEGYMSHIQHDYWSHKTNIQELKRITARNFEDPDYEEHMRAKYVKKLGKRHARDFGNVTFLMKGEVVAGYGIGVESAKNMARKKHINPADCLLFFIHEPGYMYSWD